MAKKIRGRNEGSISKRANGVWRAQISLNGKRISFSSKTKEECIAWLRKKSQQIENGLNYDRSQVALKDYLVSWLTSMKVSIRYTTWAQYCCVVGHNILPGIGHIKMVDLKPDHIQHLYDALLGRKIGHFSLLKTHTVLRSALSRAVKVGMIPHNPACAVMLPKEPATEMKILDEAQVNQLLVIALQHRWEVLFHLAVTTGMREMELLGLKWTDLDWVNQTLKVERQLLRPHGEGVQFSSPKTKFGKRTLKLGSKTIEVLRRHSERQRQDRIAAGDHWNEYGLIITNHSGGPIQYRNLLREYKKLLKDAGLPSIRFHDLRHTAASLMLNRNVPVIVVSRRLGHSKPSITLDIYGHLISSAESEVAELIDEMISPIELHQTAPDLHQICLQKSQPEIRTQYTGTK